MEKYFGWPVVLSLQEYVCFPHFWLRAGEEWMPQHMELGWSVNNFFQSSFQSTEGFRQYRLPNIIYAFWPYLPPWIPFYRAFAFAVFKVKRHESVFFTIFTVAGILMYTIFLAGMAYQNQRFLIISFPLVLLVLYPAFSRLWENHCPKFMKNLVWIAIMIAQLSFSAYAMNPLIKRNHLERQAVRCVMKYKSAVLYTFDIDLALKIIPGTCRGKKVFGNAGMTTSKKML